MPISPDRFGADEDGGEQCQVQDGGEQCEQCPAVHSPGLTGGRETGRAKRGLDAVE